MFPFLNENVTIMDFEKWLSVIFAQNEKVILSMFFYYKAALQLVVPAA